MDPEKYTADDCDYLLEIMDDLDADRIVITIEDVDGARRNFKVHRTTSFGDLMTTYAKTRGWDAEELRFLFEGGRLEAGETPDDVAMKYYDVIVAFRPDDAYGLQRLLKRVDGQGV
jgi:hypothetical protein